MEVLLAKERIFKLIQAWDEKQIESWSFLELLPQFLNDSRTIEQAANFPVQQEQEEQADYEEMQQDREKFMQDTQTFLEKFNRFFFGFTPRVLTIAWERIDKINPTFFYDDDEESSIQYKEYLEKFPDAVTTVLPTEEPEYSLSMGYEHLSITSEMKSNEIIKFGVEELLPIPSECEVTLEDKKECDLPISENSPIYDGHSDFKNDDDISSDDDDFEDVKYIEASLSDPEIVNVVLREKLLSITRLISNIESLNDNPTPDRVLNSFESDKSLSDNFSPEFKTFCDHTEETRSGNTTHADNSLPEYDLFCFEIEPDKERLINVMKNDIPNDSSNDPLLKEADLFLASDNSIPPVPLPPPEPPDAETDAGEEIPVVVNDKDKFDEDYYFFHV
nr:hypothetical protein [Tanacetum cinerariifolium]